MPHETSADGSNSGTCVPTCGDGGDDHESMWSVCLGVLSNIQLIFNVCEQRGQDTASNLPDELHSDPGRCKKPVPSHDTEKGTVFFSCLSPGQRRAIIWTNVGILLIGPLGINFSEILIEINTFSFNKMHLKMSSGKWRLFRLGLNVLNWDGTMWHSSNSRHPPLRNPTTWGPNNDSNSWSPDIGCHITTKDWDGNLYTVASHSWRRSSQMRHIAFGAFRDINTPGKEAELNWTKVMGDNEIVPVGRNRSFLYYQQASTGIGIDFHGPLTRYAKFRVAHAPGMPGTFPHTADFKRNR